MYSSEVVYDIVPNSHQRLEAAVKLHSYPPAIHYAVIYCFPPDCYRVVKMNNLNIEGTNKGQIAFPFKVYEVKSKSPSFAVLY